MIWRPVVGFPTYEVSDTGLVRSTKTRKYISPAPSHNGYLRVRIIKDGDVYCRRLHHLVLEAFVGPRPTPQHHGAHGPDRRKTNNRIDNLRWALPVENEADKKVHGTWRTGKHRRFTTAEIERIRSECAEGVSDSEIARRRGVHRHTISRIRRELRHKPEQAVS